MSLSDTAHSILIAASQHLLGLAATPAALPAAAGHAVFRSLLRQGLVAECSAPAGHPELGWRQAVGTMTVMQITGAGRQTIGYDEPGNAVDDAELDDPSQAIFEAKPDDDHDPMAAAGIVPANSPTEAHSKSLAPPTATATWSSSGFPTRRRLGVCRTPHFRGARKLTSGNQRPRSRSTPTWATC